MGLAISSFLTLSDESTTASIKIARCADKDDFPTPGKPQMMTINNYTVLYMDFRARAYYLLLLNGTKIHSCYISTPRWITFRSKFIFSQFACNSGKNQRESHLYISYLSHIQIVRSNGSSIDNGRIQLQ